MKTSLFTTLLVAVTLFVPSSLEAQQQGRIYGDPENALVKMDFTGFSKEEVEAIRCSDYFIIGQTDPTLPDGGSRIVLRSRGGFGSGDGSIVIFLPKNKFRTIVVEDRSKTPTVELRLTEFAFASIVPGEPMVLSFNNNGVKSATVRVNIKDYLDSTKCLPRPEK